MSGFTQFLGAVAGQVASRVILNKVANVGLSQSREPAREPGAYQKPVIVPKGAEFDALEAGTPSSRYKIPSWLFFSGYGALLWYAAKATAPVDIPDLGDPGPEEALLFPGLKRELTHLDVEDISTSDDPVEACLERVGWKLDRIDELRQSIFEKEQVDLFTTPEPLTRSEGELLEAIETCMQKLEIQYGSLEAAGVACSACGDPDLGAVQREMFDPEQIEIDYDSEPHPTSAAAMDTAGITDALMDYMETVGTKEKKQGLTNYRACLHVYGDQCDSPGDVNYDRVHNLIKSWGYDRMSQVFYDYQYHPDKLTASQGAAAKSPVLPMKHDTGEVQRLYEYLDALEGDEPANILDACNFILGSEKCETPEGDIGIDFVNDLVKQEGYFYLDDLRKVYKSKIKIPAHRKTGG